MKADFVKVLQSVNGKQEKEISMSEADKELGSFFTQATQSDMLRIEAVCEINKMG